MKQESGAIRNGGELQGFFVTIKDFSELEVLVQKIMADGGTQPSYAKGVARGAGAFISILMGNSTPERALQNPALTADYVEMLRKKQKEYQ